MVRVCATIYGNGKRWLLHYYACYVPSPTAEDICNQLPPRSNSARSMKEMMLEFAVVIILFDVTSAELAYLCFCRNCSWLWQHSSQWTGSKDTVILMNSILFGRVYSNWEYSNVALLHRISPLTQVPLSPDRATGKYFRHRGVFRVIWFDVF